MMAIDVVTSLLNQAAKVFEQEGNLIQIESGRVVFAGDTHGDVEATKRIVERYLKADNQIVFLGDYVDRGPASKENLTLLLKLKLEHPDSLFLLMGNHEGQKAIPFHPADFWEQLDDEQYVQYATALSRLPLVVSTSNGIIALHGVLPEVDTMEDIERIEFGDEQWHQTTWGDWQEKDGGYLNNGFLWGRPQFGQDWFEKMMGRLGKNVLIRSHQPNVKPVIFNDRCLTIFTSSAYRSSVAERTIAITDLSKTCRTVDDLILEAI